MQPKFATLRSADLSTATPRKNPTLITVRKLIVEALNGGGPMTQRDLAMAVNRGFAIRGGRFDSISADSVMLKMALAAQIDADLLHQPASGLYAIGPSPEGAAAQEEDDALIDAMLADDDSDDNETSAVVYLYYYESERVLAEKMGRPVWPCKIGFSEKGVDGRIKGQAITAMHSPPITALRLPISKGLGKVLERVIHSGLRIIRARMPLRPGCGQEWYVTSPAEVLAMYNALVGWREGAKAIDRHWY